MTRFARARGSKSSNERVPEEATSWSEMRRGLQRESVRKAAEEQIARESHLGRQQDSLNSSIEKSTTKKKATDPVELVSFDDVPQSSGQSIQRSAAFNKSHNQKAIKKTEKIQEAPNRKRPHPDSFTNSAYVEENEPFCGTQSTRLENLINESTCSQKSEEGTSKYHNVKTKQKNSHLSEKQKNASHPSSSANQGQQSFQRQDKKTFKEVDDSEPNIGGFFKGYPVPLDDAETLTDAYNILRKEGLTHQQAMERTKPERRRAEKRLARLKSMICFRCRKPGHRLSDCPMGGIECDVCFKCGSTTHKYQECKKKGSFVNAKCFICGVVGHLSAQCPENAHGVYPEGGQCKICGDKTHLVKDCPQNRSKKEQHAGTTEFDDYYDEKPTEPTNPKKKKKTTVQF